MKATKVDTKTQVTSSKIQLNDQNYYDKSTDSDFQSATWFKKFLTCEAAAKAELIGSWEPPQDNVALLLGNYVHSYFESEQAHADFITANHDAMIKKDGTLLAKYSLANDMIATLESDQSFISLYQGEKEAIVTGEIFGIEWKGKIDCLNLERGYFIDLKTTADLHKKYWSVENHAWQSFADKYNYQLQMWVYQKLIQQTYGVLCTPYIIAVDKHRVPDKAIISIPDYRMQEARDLIRTTQKNIEAVRNGNQEPSRCEICDYCRSTKKLNTIISMDDLIQ